MTTEIRSQLNVRLTTEANLSISVSTFVADESEAHEAGVRSQRIVSAYLDGYNEAPEPEESE